MRRRPPHALREDLPSKRSFTLSEPLPGGLSFFNKAQTPGGTSSGPAEVAPRSGRRPGDAAQSRQRVRLESARAPKASPPRSTERFPRTARTPPNPTDKTPTLRATRHPPSSRMSESPRRTDTDSPSTIQTCRPSGGTSAAGLHAPAGGGYPSAPVAGDAPPQRANRKPGARRKSTGARQVDYLSDRVQALLPSGFTGVSSVGFSSADGAGCSSTAFTVIAPLSNTSR